LNNTASSFQSIQWWFQILKLGDWIWTARELERGGNKGGGMEGQEKHSSK